MQIDKGRGVGEGYVIGRELGRRWREGEGEWENE